MFSCFSCCTESSSQAESGRKGHPKNTTTKGSSTGVLGSRKTAKQLQKQKDAIRGIVQDLESDAATRIPSFEWRFRKGYGQTAIGDAGAKRIAAVLLNHPSNTVEALELHNQEIADDGAVALGRTLQRLGGSKITTMMLSKNQITHKGIAILAEAIQCSNLQRVVLCDNPIGSEGVELIARAVASDECKVKFLELGAAFIPPSESSSSSSVHHQDFSKLNNVDSRSSGTTGGSSSNTFITLGDTELRVGGSMALRDLVGRRSRLRTFKYSGRGACLNGSTSLRQFMDSLMQNYSLVELSLSDCVLRPSPTQLWTVPGSSALAGGQVVGPPFNSSRTKPAAVASAASASSPNSKSPDASNYGSISSSPPMIASGSTLAGVAGAVGLRVATAPAGNSSSSNSNDSQKQQQQTVHLEWVSSLANVIARPRSTVTTIELSKIVLEDVGVGMLAVRGLSESKSLSELTMQNCNFGSVGLQSLATSLTKNASLRKLDISGSYHGGGPSSSPTPSRLMSSPPQADPPADVVTAMRNLMRALCKNATLSELNLAHWPFGNEAAEELCDTLENGGNRTLRNVRHGTVPSDAIGTRLENLLTRNEHLTRSTGGSVDANDTTHESTARNNVLLLAQHQQQEPHQVGTDGMGRQISTASTLFSDNNSQAPLVPPQQGAPPRQHKNSTVVGDHQQQMMTYGPEEDQQPQRQPQQLKATHPTSVDGDDRVRLHDGGSSTTTTTARGRSDHEERRGEEGEKVQQPQRPSLSEEEDYPEEYLEGGAVGSRKKDQKKKQSIVKGGAQLTSGTSSSVGRLVDREGEDAEDEDETSAISGTSSHNNRRHHHRHAKRNTYRATSNDLSSSSVDQQQQYVSYTSTATTAAAAAAAAATGGLLTKQQIAAEQGASANRRHNSAVRRGVHGGDDDDDSGGGGGGEDESSLTAPLDPNVGGSVGGGGAIADEDMIDIEFDDEDF